MRYLKVGIAEPFVVVCDGEHDYQLALARLDRDPFTWTRVDETGPRHGLQEITLSAFLRLHDETPKEQ